jgi:2-iminobutanoate/2-iminopropanoate deaminase
MSKTAITSPELTPPVGPFSQAIEVDGFLYLSGQVAQDPTTGKLVPGGVVAETEQVLSNAAAVLRAADMGFDDVVSVRVFLTRMEDYRAMNAILRPPFQRTLPSPHRHRRGRLATGRVRRDRHDRQTLRASTDELALPHCRCLHLLGVRRQCARRPARCAGTDNCPGAGDRSRVQPQRDHLRLSRRNLPRPF